MGRVRSPYVRSRVRWYRRVLLDPAALRYWLAVAALAIVLGAVLASTLGRAAAARARWGDTAEVWVAEVDLAPGDSVADGTRTARWPTVLIPPDAVDRVDGSARASLPVAEGQVVTGAALDPASDPAVLADRRTVAVPRGDAALPVEVGQRVEVWGVVATVPGLEEAAPAGRLAVGAVVVAVDERTATVAVEPDEVAEVAAVAAAGAVALVGRS